MQAKPWEKYGAPQQQGSGVPDVIPLPRTPQQQAEEDRRNREEGYQRGDRSTDVATTLRKEFQAREEAKNYAIALGTYNSALNTKPTAEGDQSLIVSFARMLDPNSVVREGEFATAANNEAAFTKLTNDLKRQLGVDGAGRLSEQGRARLREEMRNLVLNRFKAPYDQLRQEYMGFAEASGVSPDIVVGRPPEAAFPKGILDEPLAPTEEQKKQLALGDTKSVELPKEYQDAVNGYLAANIRNLDPSQYAAFRVQLDQQFGFPGNIPYYVQDGQRMRDEFAQGAPLSPISPTYDAQSSPFEQGVTNFAQTPFGAAVTTYLNSATAGIPARLSGRNEQVEAVRQNQPIAGLAGDIAGGISGSLMLGSGLGAMGARGLMANPMVQNAAFGGVQGAMESENPLTGAAMGVGGSLLGDLGGRAIGRALPGMFAPGAMRAAKESVPTSGQLGIQADDLYRRAMAEGQVAPAQRVDDFIDQTEGFLRSNGMMTQQGELLGSGPLQDAYRLLKSFRGREMTPLEAKTVREKLAEGRMAMKEGAPDPRARMLSGDLTEQFDNFADDIMPGIGEARAVAQRRILGREMERTRELGQARGEINYSQGSEDLGIRRAFGALDTGDVRGSRMYPPDLSEAIRTVSRGTPARNIAQWLGRFSPQGGTGLAGGGLLGTMAGGATDNLVTGGAVTGGLYTAGLLGRAAANRMTRNDAELAELIARGGPGFQAALQQVRDEAATRGGRIGAGIFGSAAIAPTRDY